MTYLLAFASGIAFGALFAWLKLPIPAPISIAGVVGILGVTIGYILVTGG